MPLIVIVGHYLWMAVLYIAAGIYSRSNPLDVVKNTDLHTLPLSARCLRRQRLRSRSAARRSQSLRSGMIWCICHRSAGSAGRDGYGVARSDYGVLGFDETGSALMLTIFALQDSFGTACNITGDGALTMILSGYADRHNIKEQNLKIDL